MGSSPTAPTPPKFIPVDIAQAESGFEQYQRLGYSTADQDFLSRFPGLVMQRQANVRDAASQITGPLAPEVENQFSTDALARSFSSTGGTGLSSIGGAGSFNRGGIAADITQQTQAKQDSDRQYMMQQFADNPARSFTLSPDDVVNIAVGNTMGANAQRFQAYAGGVAQSNAQQAAQSQEIFAGAGLAVSLLGTLATVL